MNATVKLGERMKPSRAGILFAVGAAVVIGAVVRLFPLVIVDTGEVAVPVRFGVVGDEVLHEGLHVVDPFKRFPRMTVRRNILEMSSGGGAAQASGVELVALSADQLTMSIDIGFPYALNPDSASRIYQRVGGDASIDQLIRPAARTAVRDAVARFSWEDAATHQREALAAMIGARFRSLVESDLRGLGLTEAQAQNAFSLLPVQLRRMVPPQSMQEAVAEKLRAQQDLQRQETLTQIARMEAERRATEGMGLAKLFGELPKGYSAEQIAVVLNAMANKTRADGLLQASQGNKVQMIIMEGGGQLPVQVNSAPATAGR